MITDVIRSALLAAEPGAAVTRSLHWLDASRLSCGAFSLPVGASLLLLAAGKASVPMSLAALRVLRARPAAPAAPPMSLRGLVVTKTGHASAADALALAAAGVDVVEAAHPVPDAAGAAAAARMLRLVRGAAPADAVLLLLSGGGSALLPAPAAGLTLADLRAMNAALLEAGAAIDEVNALRKHTSALSGGRLAAACAAPLLTLALSDVVGDRADVIASGPSVLPDPSTWAHCAAVLARYAGLAAALPPAVVAAVAAARAEDETPKHAPPPGRQHVAIVGSARAALRAVARALRERHAVPALLLTAALQGEAAEVARALLAALADAPAWEFGGAPLLQPAPRARARVPRVALLVGGETTVTLRAHAGAPPPGRGGRNQELALAVLVAAAAAEAGTARAAAPPFTEGDVGVLCLGTDGSDGPTDAAGAYIASARAHARVAAACGLDAAAALRRHDAYTFFAALDGPMAAAAEAAAAEAAAAAEMGADAGAPPTGDGAGGAELAPGSAAAAAAASAAAAADDTSMPTAITATPTVIRVQPGGLVLTGPTGTNVGDVYVLFLY